jgi:hypothetical protein
VRVPYSGQPIVTVHVFGVQGTQHEDGKIAEWAGPKQTQSGTGWVNRHDFKQFYSQRDLDGSILQVFQNFDGYGVVIYTASDKYNCSTSFS